jgi:hypothetical protein
MLNSFRIWSTIQLNTPSPHPPTATHCLYILQIYFGGGGGRGGQREGKGATVHERGPSSMEAKVHDTFYAVVIASLYSEEMKNKLL